jgi:hypothetical protein
MSFIVPTLVFKALSGERRMLPKHLSILVDEESQKLAVGQLNSIWASCSFHRAIVSFVSYDPMNRALYLCTLHLKRNFVSLSVPVPLW